MKRRPHAEMLVIPRLECNLLRRPVRQPIRINGKDLFAVVLVSLDESVEQPTRLCCHHVLQDSAVKVVVQFLLQCMFYGIQLPRSGCSARGRSRNLLYLFISAVSEPQNSGPKLLVDGLLFCQ